MPIFTAFNNNNKSKQEICVSSAKSVSVKEKRERRIFWKKVLFFIIPAVLFIALFFPSFSSNARFSYRDVSYYYYPLFQQIQTEWEHGRIPLWNPNENLGQPLIGDPTASAFYPGKAIFFLSSIGLCSYNLCFKLYIWIHVALMYLLSYLLARRLKISPMGAMFAALCYAFSGQTLFQYSNVIYLIGAAWVPALLIYTINYFEGDTVVKKIEAIIKLSLLQTLVILGGEPQIVYLSLLIGAISLLFYPIRLNSERQPLLDNNQKNLTYSAHRYLKIHIPSNQSHTNNIKNRFYTSVSFLCFTSILTFGLAAIQIVPSLEVISNSTRTSTQQVASLWEIPQSFFPENNSSDSSQNTIERSRFQELLCSDFSQNGRSRSIYRFSIGPWRLLEFIFPNIGGKQFPQYSRWFAIFPEEISVWTPSLYFGAFPFLLGLSAFCFYNSDKTSKFWQVFFTWLTIISCLAAFGGFGLIWLYRTFEALLYDRTIPTCFTDYDPVGGIYWFLNLTIPKFAQFRYPAKLLTLAIIGFSVLSGMGWDRIHSSKKVTILSVIACVMAIIGLTISIFVIPKYLLNLNIQDPLFGKFQAKLAYKTVIYSFVQSIGVIITSLCIISFLKKKSLNNHTLVKGALTFSLLTLTAADIFIANSWLIVTSPVSLFERTSKTQQLLINERNIRQKCKLNSFLNQEPKSPTINQNAVPPPRFYRFPVWFPPIFQETSSKHRNDERVIWDVETIFPRYGLNQGIAAIDVRGSVTESEYSKFINALLQKENTNTDLGFLGVTYVIGPKFWTKRLLSDAKINANNSQSAPNTNGLDWSFSVDKVNRPITRAGIFRNGQRIDQTYLNATLFDNTLEGSPDFSATINCDDVKIISFEPNKIVYLITTAENSEVVFAEQYWKGWKAELLSINSNDAYNLYNFKYSKEKVADEIHRLKKQTSKSPNQRTPLISDVPIEKAYGFLRKINVPKGIHCVIVKYRPPCFFIGVAISSLCWLLMILLLIKTQVRGKRSNRNAERN